MNFDSLIQSGFQDVKVEQNIEFIFPISKFTKIRKENKILSFSNYVISYCRHLKFIATYGVQTYIFKYNVDKSYKIPENAEARSPIDFCLFHIIKPKERYFSYIIK
ncbi:uncharacterized protein LOC114120385 [Aphis gossypii]|uniref:uncharacterized protein LOC114120385 n=1 Tax=Aphis gossypii TaxID=80765 RepID=UPI00215906E3|nr:uncharacterized protein LOC114120385 [Aphis gossypii]